MVTLLGQYQSVQETGSAKDPAETLLSLEETNQGLNSKVSQENNSGCTGCMKFGNHTLYTREKLNEDITLCGDCDTEDHGPDHKPSMNNRQNNMDLYTSPQSNSSEIFEDNRKETDVKSEKSKLFDATCPNDHSSLSLPQDSNVSNGIRSDDHSDEFCMLKMSKSEDGTRAQLVEDNLALRVDGTTELFESEQIGKEPCKPNHEVNNIFSTIDDCDRNLSNLNPDDDIDIDACPTTAPNNQQDGANMWEDGTIVLEDERSPDHGEDINELLNPTSSFKEADVQEKRNKAFDDTSLNDKNKTSTDHGGSNKFSLVEPKIRENDVHKGKRKMFDVPSPNVSSSTQEVSRPVDTKSCISISSNPEGSTTLFHWQLKSQKQKNIVKRHLDQNRTKQNKKVNCKTNDDKQAHNRVIGASKTDGKASIDDGCKKTTNISKTNNGTSPAAYTGRKRDNHNFKSNDVPKNHNPKDKTSSGDGGENNVLSRLKLKSKHRSQPIEKSPTVLDTTGSKCFQQHGDVSTTGRRLNAKSRTMNRSLWSAFSFGHSWVYYFLVIMALMTPSLVQASPVKPPVKPLRQMLLCSNKSLMNQSLTIKSFDHRHSPGCTFRYTTLPFSHDCSKFGYTVSALNETCVEMQIADDRSTEDWRMEYGNKANGDGLQATRGELLNNQSDIKERSEYNNSHDSSANKNQTEEQSQTEDESKKEDNRENKNENDTKLITVLVLAVLAALLVISIPLLWKFCPKFRSCVKSCKSPCTRSDTNSDPETGSNLNSNTDPNAKLSTPVPLENGNINGDDHNDVDDDESQRLNPESSEEPTPKACETSL
ncbi:uncharacterized protein [Phyllobates terribilis]|uniref:uncharacterized protein isoform X2 n=1 Tax=Phyllobates terribilis TaxID=111132 RepID=UPI003CCAE6D2